ncbi:MAG: suppressor of fused domain protein [Pirellulaceae bacterium]|nr:suppressor of fused domain protein [Pirellulaceae bacterium]
MATVSMIAVKSARQPPNYRVPRFPKDLSMKSTDVPTLAKMLGEDFKSTSVQKFLKTRRFKTDMMPADGVGQISCHDEGIEFLLDYQRGRYSVINVRLLSPEYCKGKRIRPYACALANDLFFPSNEKTVRMTLGRPSRSNNGPYRFDDYDFPSYTLRFVYRGETSQLVFLTIEFPEQDNGPIRPQDRLKDLRGARKSKWQKRYAAYVKLMGEAQEVFVQRDQPGVPSIDILAFKRAEGFFTLMTNGMSDKRMPVSRTSSECKRAELEMHVKDLRREYVDRLYLTAALPFIDRTCLKPSDTVSWGLPITNHSSLTEDLLLPSPIVRHRRLKLSVGNDLVQLLWCLQITESELDFKTSKGVQALIDAFPKIDSLVPLNPKRRSLIRSPKK